ncbi:MAG: nucleotidyltransferase domain-containing protein [Planctomycetaceae bacterium]
MATILRSAQQTYAMLGSSSLWDVARKCDELLRQAGLPHALVGGMTVCLHGYRRNTVDVDLLVRSDDSEAVRATLENAGFAWDAEQREFRGEENVPVQCFVSEEPAGDDRSYNVKLPDPSTPGVTAEIEGLTVISLSRLIELNLACGLGNSRRAHRDLADVVELIIIHDLGRDFARYLHKSLRKEFRNLVQRARGA